MAALTHLSETALIERSLAGDREAFGVLADRHLRPAYGLAFALTGSREESEDLAQEAFLRAWRELGTLRRRESFTAWIGAVVRNLAATSRRSELRRRRTLEALARSQEGAAGDERERMEKSEAERFLRQALDGLPEDLKTPLVLFYFEGESTARVAERLGLRPATARKRIQLARDRLRDTLLERLAGALAVIAPGPEVFRRIEGALADAPAGIRRSRPRPSPLPGDMKSAILLGGLFMSAKTLGASLLVWLLITAAFFVVADPLGFRAPSAGSPPPGSPPSADAVRVELAERPKEIEARLEAAPLEAPKTSGEPTKVVTGIVIDARTSLPVEGAVIRDGRHAGGKPVEGGDSCRSGPDGQFRWIVPATQMSFDVTSRGYAPSGGEANEDSEQVIALDPVLPISGWVLDEEDEPIGGARIEAIEVRIFGIHMSSSGQPVFSAADGSFRLDPPMTGRTRLAVDKPGWGGTIAGWIALGAEDVLIKLPRGGRVEGRVLDGPEEPGAGARVRWTTVKPEGPSWSGETVSAGDGSFVIEGIPAPGVHWIYLDGGIRDPARALADGFADLSREVRVQRGETVKDVVLDRGLLPAMARAKEWRKEELRSKAHGDPKPPFPSWRFGFWGSVLDAGGRPVPYAKVHCEIRYETGTSSFYARTDGEGRFAYEPKVTTGFPGNACRARIWVSHGSFADYVSDFRDVPLPVSAMDGAKVTIGPFEARLREGFRLTGRVRGPDGNLLGDVQVYLSRRTEAGSYCFHELTRADGSFRVDHVSRTLLGLVFHHPQAAPLRVPLTAAGVPDGQTFDLGDIRLETGATLRGILRRAGDSPAPDIEVTLEEGQFHPAARTDEEGRFVLEHVQPGKHSFRLSPEARLAPPGTVEIAPGEVERDVEIRLED